MAKKQFEILFVIKYIYISLSKTYTIECNESGVFVFTFSIELCTFWIAALHELHIRAQLILLFPKGFETTTKPNNFQ